MICSSFVTRHGVGHLFRKCLAGRSVQRRLLKAFTLCTLPAMSLGAAYGQDTPFGASFGDDAGVADLSAFQQDPDDGGFSSTTSWATPVNYSDNEYSQFTPSAPAFSPEMFEDSEGFATVEGDGGASNVSYQATTADGVSGSATEVEQTQFSTFAPRTVATGPDGQPLGFGLTLEDLVQYRIGRNNIQIAGTPRGWTTMSAFVPFADGGGDQLFFVNPQIMIDDAGRAGGNLGLGTRWYDSTSDRAHEISIWGDFDDGFNKTTSGVGLAAALVSPFIEYRVGANFVLSENLTNVGGPIFGTTATVQGSNVVIPSTQFVEAAYDRFEFEAAAPFSFLGPWGGTAGLGAYGLSGPSGQDGGLGVSGRFEMQINENFFANVVVTNDPVFDTNVSFNFEYTLPNGRSREWLRKPQVRDFMTSTTRRRHRPTVEYTSVTATTQVLNKAGDAYEVAVVDPNRGAGVLGTGSIDDPFGSLQALTGSGSASDFEIIVVRPFLGATPRPQDTNLNTTIALSDGQILTSDALAVSLPGTVSGTAGRFTVAPLRFTNPLLTTPLVANSPVFLPTLSNSGAVGTNVITLANDNLVQGLRIDATDTANGINSEVAGITGFTIQNNEFVRFIEGAHIDHTGNGYGVFQENFVHGRVSNAGDSTFSDLGIELADLGLTQAEVEAAATAAAGTPVTFADEAAALASITLDTLRPTIVGTSNGLGDGFGRVRGLQIIHDSAAAGGELDLYIANNKVEGVAGEDRNQNGLLDVPPTVPAPGEDVNGNGILDPGRAIRVEIVNGTLDANDPDVARTFDANFCLTTFPTGIVGNTIGEFTAGMTPAPIAGSGSVYGIDVVGRAGTTLNLVERNNMAGGGVGAAGQIDPSFRILSDGADINVDEFAGNVSNGSFQDGAQFVAVQNGTIDFANPLFIPSQLLVNPTALPSFRGNTFTNSGTNGVYVQALGGQVTFDGIGYIAPDLSTGVNTFTNNAGDGLLFEAADIGAFQGVISVADRLTAALQPIAGNTVSGNGGNGVTLRITQGGTINAGFGQRNLDGTLALGQSFTGNRGAGLSVQNVIQNITPIVPDSQLTVPLLPPLMTSIPVTTPGAAINTSLFGVTATGNTGNGAEFIAIQSAINVASMENLNFNQNGDVASVTGAGLEIRVGEGGTFTTPSIINSTFNNNQRAGLLLTGTGSNVTGTVSQINIPLLLNNQFNRVANGTIAATSGFGVELNLLETTLSPMVIQQNQFLASGTAADSGPGFGGVVDAGRFGGGVDLTFGANNAADTNAFVGNGDAHIGILFQGPSVNQVRINNHTFANAVDRSALTTTLPNSFDGDGVAFTLQDTSTLGGFIVNSKIFDNNGDGIDLAVTGNNGAANAAIQNFLIQNNAIIGNGDGTFPGTPNEGGDNGIEVNRTANGQLTNLMILNNQVDANANNGLRVDVANAFIQDTVVVRNNTFNDNGFSSQTVLIPSPNGTDNNNDGIPDPFPVALVPNGNVNPAAGIQAGDFIDLNNNGIVDAGEFFDADGDGIADPTELPLLAASVVSGRTTTPGVGLPDTSDANGEGNGALFIVRGDALLDVDLFDNQFNRNAENGVRTNEQDLTITDARRISGTWQRNQFTDNLQDGIALDAASTGLIIGGTAAALNGPPGPGPTRTPADGNLIERNGSDGIEVTSGGDVVISDNIIRLNGLGTTNITDIDEGTTFNNVAGIDFNLTVDINDNMNAIVRFNDITDNRGDGIEWSNIGTDGTGFGLIVEDNSIDFNDGRGVDFLLHADEANEGDVSVANFVLNRNFINTNLREGVVLMGTNDALQDQSGLIYDAFRADDNFGGNNGPGQDNPAGNTGAQYFLTFNLDSNEINNNGISLSDTDGFIGNADNATGLLLLVGTTGGNYAVGRDGGFATDDTGALINPGMLGSITNNTLTGNQGDDLYVQSFTSTGDPNTGTTWTTAAPGGMLVFNSNGYQGDPLARLDLTYLNNTLNTSNALTVGAVYNDADGAFKSRTSNGNTFPGNVAGPFANASRNRNAQRIGDRLYPNGTFLNPPDAAFAGVDITSDVEIIGSPGGTAFNSTTNNGNGGIPEGFVFPGMGDSTFRLNTAAGMFNAAELIAVFGSGTVLTFDTASLVPGSPIQSLGDANGIAPAEGNRTPTPYGWGTFTIGDGTPH